MTTRLLLGLGLLLLAVVPAPAASADDPDPAVQVSSDGLSWSSDLATPLFDPAVRWVPGDVRTSTFFVRNGSPHDAVLRLEPKDSRTGSLTAQGVVLLDARTDGGQWHRLTVDAESGRLNPTALPAGEVTRVDVRAELDPAATNSAQDRAANLSFVLRLSDALAEPQGTGDTGTTGGQQSGHQPGDQPGHQPGSSSGGHEPLADTGAPDVRLQAAAGALLLGCGLVLVRRRREVRHG